MQAKRQTVSWARTGVVMAAFGLVLAAVAYGYAGALQQKESMIDSLRYDIDRMEKIQGDNIMMLSKQQKAISELRTGASASEGLTEQPSQQPIVLRGTAARRDELQLETVTLAGKGEIVINAQAEKWAEDTSVGMQIWHPKEDGVLFRGGHYRVVIKGSARLNDLMPDWDHLRTGTHAYKISWDAETLRFLVDGKLVRSVARDQLPPPSTNFLIRFNADYEDTLTIQSYSGKYKDDSGQWVTIP